MKAVISGPYLSMMVFAIVATALAAGKASQYGIRNQNPARGGFNKFGAFQMAQTKKDAKKAQNQAGRYSGDLRITSKLLARDFIPDGDLGKAAWQAAESVSFHHDALGRKQFPESATRVASLWSKRHVYFAYWCQYSTLNIYEGEDAAKERWELWNRDVVEVFLNPQPERFNHYYEFEVAPNNQWIDLEIDLDKTPFNSAAWNSDFEHATRIDASNQTWTCEMRIPITAMGAKPLKVNSEWRLNFYRADGPGDDTMRRFLSWNLLPTSKLSFHQPASFGIIRFVN
jgi:hypothetical protein